MKVLVLLANIAGETIRQQNNGHDNNDIKVRPMHGM